MFAKLFILLHLQNLISKDGKSVKSCHHHLTPFHVKVHNYTFIPLCLITLLLFVVALKYPKRDKCITKWTPVLLGYSSFSAFISPRAVYFHHFLFLTTTLTPFKILWLYHIIFYNVWSFIRKIPSIPQIKYPNVFCTFLKPDSSLRTHWFRTIRKIHIIVSGIKYPNLFIFFNFHILLFCDILCHPKINSKTKRIIIYKWNENLYWIMYKY